MSRWSAGEADVENLLTERALQPVTGSTADGTPGLTHARQTLTSAQVLLSTDPTNALVLAYDAARQACTALLTQQGLRPTTTSGHIAVERAVHAQFGTPFTPYGGLRRRRNEIEYPNHPDEDIDADETTQAPATAEAILDATTKLLPQIGAQCARRFVATSSDDTRFRQTHGFQGGLQQPVWPFWTQRSRVPCRASSTAHAAPTNPASPTPPNASACNHPTDWRAGRGW